MVQTSLSETDLLRGIVDRLFVAADGEIHILDYKTDKTTGAENPAKKTRYAFQLKFYAYLVSLLFPEKERIHATLYYTAFGSTESYTFGRKDFAGIESTLTEMIEKARGLENVTKLTSIERNLSHCRECAYFDETAQQCSVTAAATLD
jgi:putative RecB family exonuclease